MKINTKVYRRSAELSGEMFSASSFKPRKSRSIVQLILHFFKCEEDTSARSELHFERHVHLKIAPFLFDVRYISLNLVKFIDSSDVEHNFFTFVRYHIYCI